jgi:hypothetical protein
MNNLAEKWATQGKVRQLSFPTSVRLRPVVDRGIQDLLEEFPHLTQTQIINDLLSQGLENLARMRT